MPGYVDKALQQFNHPRLCKRQDAPYPHTPLKYGAKQQYASAGDTSPLLSATDKKFIQQVIGKFLYLGRAVDPTLQMPLSALGTQQTKPTE